MRPAWWREFLQKVKMFFYGFKGFSNYHFTDKELETLLLRGYRKTRSARGAKAEGGDARFAALRREGAPNTAEESGQMRDSHVPHEEGFMEKYRFDGKGLYADYEFLYGRHPEYFEDVEHVRAAVEFVLAQPEEAGNIRDNLAFVREDQSTGKVYRVEINPKIIGKRCQIRSVHEITQTQYKKIKDRTARGDSASPDSVRHEQEFKASEHPNMKTSDPSEKAKAGATPANAASPVLQPSQNRVRQTDTNGDLTGRQGRTVSDFLRYDSTESGKVKYSQEGGTRFSIIGGEGAGRGREAEGAAEKRAYYQIPFSEGLARVVDPAQKDNHSPVYVRNTPKIFQDIGFTTLPMMMNSRHLRLNYYNGKEFVERYGKLHKEEHAHGLHDAMLTLPGELEHPLAIVVNKTPNATPGSIVCITDVNVGGKKIVVPLLIETVSRADKHYIDSHLVLTVYDAGNWVDTFLKPALEEEKKKRVGIFYFDKEKAKRYKAGSKNPGVIPSGIVHTIHDEGSPVKGEFKKQTETLQFKEWFGKSKVVDEEGKPLVVYHGTDSDFTVFDMDKTRSNMDIRGAFFSPYEDESVGYGKNVRAFFLSIQKPATAEQAYKVLRMFQREKDAGTKARDYLIKQGYDGVVDEGYEYIAFYPEQVKSATDNIGTFDPENPDVRFSIEQYSDADWSDMVTYLKAKVGNLLTKPDGEYKKILEDAGMECYSEADAHACAVEAMNANLKDAQARRKEEMMNWIVENNTWIQRIAEVTGSPEFKIRPSYRFQGMDFTGAYISQAWRDCSGNPKAKNREKRLREASGYHSDELAQMIADKFGGDAIEIENDLIEYFQHKKKKASKTERENDKAEADTALVKAQAIQMLAAAGYVVPEDEVRKVFGYAVTYREPQQNPAGWSGQSMELAEPAKPETPRTELADALEAWLGPEADARAATAELSDEELDRELRNGAPMIVNSILNADSSGFEKLDAANMRRSFDDGNQIQNRK